MERNAAEGRLTFTTDLAEGLDGARCAFITVGTPCSPDGSCDLSYVHEVARRIGELMTDEIIVVDKSTVPVGTADAVREVIRGELKRRGSGLAFDVVSNPEFLKEGDAINDFMKPDRVVVVRKANTAPRCLGTVRSLCPEPGKGHRHGDPQCGNDQVRGQLPAGHKNFLY